MFLTLDGVYQGQGSADEDRRGGFERGGWVAGRTDDEIWPYITSVYARADAFLLGRRTWQSWAAYWPHHDGGDPVSHGLKVLPKYVPSSTLTDPTWQHTHVITGDGLRVFPERGQTHDMTLVESRTTPSGVTLQTYQPTGRATYGTVG